MEQPDQSIDADLAALNALVSRVNAELEQEAAEQLRIERELEELIACNPVGQQLTPQDCIRVRAAIEARQAFEEFKTAVNRLRAFVEYTMWRVILLQENPELVTSSNQAIACSAAQLEMTERIIAAPGERVLDYYRKSESNARKF